ncbi:lycopene cyclase family protein [Flavobacterium subsaxonicum]|uniref:Lycopene cyclase n=1 Tax=Flavobacterium subsaxonicum WB 4.1-42 = DSM 21790 TaxID=1121898 RepID=A0A0A2MIG5_9FLAO|nr:lycopene cyclase family protein [Flavobacterium subsaxonicum]KGO91391.1 lycopene cyclase [Flavobacterium subsaxonicum WB 4.1-42 = DSM 21790]
MKHYHYIFAGAGLSGLMTVYRMAISGRFNDASILLLDTDTKKENDRTWCFWQRGITIWDDIILRHWNTALFASQNFRTDLDFDGYEYNMIRGIDFYNFVLAELKKHSNIAFAHQKVTDFADLGMHVLVKTDVESYTCNKLFNSIYNPALPASQKKYPLLQQHFIGWHVKTDTPAFNAHKPTFMDFSIVQKGNTRFMYVLPFSGTEAIVEYTLFSKDLLAIAEYEEAIKQYLTDKGITEYEIVDKERGSIPMTSYKFWEHNTKNILNIGSAGGWTKASTGYTFKNADKKSREVVHFIQSQNDFTKFYKKNKFWGYDLLLLDILARKNHKGSAIFAAMFKNGKAAPIFKFLDEETTLSEDLAVISKCPKGLFINALLRRMLNL